MARLHGFGALWPHDCMTEALRRDGARGAAQADRALGRHEQESGPHAGPLHLMHPVQGPPSDRPATTSVSKMFFFQTFPAQAALSSRMSASPLPSTLFSLTMLGAPSASIQIP